MIHAYCIRNEISFDQIKEYLDLLTISIGADIVPMTGENRVFAFYGLNQISLNSRAGLKALMNERIKSKELSMSDIVFSIAPKINAAGRIAHAKKSVEILVEQDYDKAKIIAMEIEKTNQTRKDLDQKTTKEALEMIDVNKKSTVVFSSKWHKGVIGIVASRLIEKHTTNLLLFL